MAELNFPITTKVAGVSSYQAALLKCYRYHPLRLIREPENAYDPNTIMVRWNGRKVGYVPAPLAKDLAPLMDAGKIGLPKFVRMNVSSKHATEGLTIKIERNN